MGRQKHTLPTILGMSIIAFALLYALLIRPNLYLLNGGTISFDATYVESLEVNQQEQVATMGEALFIASTEGLTKKDLEGNNIWNKSYHIDELLFLVEEPYMAVVGLTEKTAYLFHEDGFIKELETSYDIISARLTNTGYLMLMEEGDGANYYHLYDRLGEAVIDHYTNYGKDGYPVEMAMSDSGSYFVRNNLNVGDYVLKSTLTLMDFTRQGANYVDNVVAFENYTDELVSYISFFGEEGFVAVSDQTMRFYDSTQGLVLVGEKNLEAKVKDIEVTDEHLLVWYQPEEGVGKEYLRIYSDKGVEEDRLYFDETITGIQGNGATYYVFFSSKIMKMEKAKKIWESKLPKTPLSCMEIDNKRLLLSYPNDFEIVRMKDL